MKFIELTQHNLQDEKFNRAMFVNVRHIESIVADVSGKYTVISMQGEGDPMYFVKEPYETVCAMIRTGYE